MADEEEEEAEGAAGGTDLLLAGPETLIFARPGDKVEDVEGEEDNAEGDIGGRDFTACPVRKNSFKNLYKKVFSLVLSELLQKGDTEITHPHLDTNLQKSQSVCELR